MPDPRNDAMRIWNAGLEAVGGKKSVARMIRASSQELWIGDHAFAISDFDRIVLLGAGKAASAMAEGFVEAVDLTIPIIGWLNVPEGTERVIPGVKVHVARPAGVNEPRPEGVQGTKQLLKLALEATPRDLCIVLMSGGGSALMPAPIDGISLDDKIELVRFLSAEGSDIESLNTVRKHLSKVKGGRLKAACNAGQLVTLILSDVLGDPLDLIASGPTIDDPSTPQDALSVLSRFDPTRKLSGRIYEALENSPQRNCQKTIPALNVVVGNNAIAVDEAGVIAEHLGYNHIMHSASNDDQAAEQVGRKHAEMLVGMLRSSEEHRANCLVTGGEPVVELAPAEIRGRGGRNQQLVLAAYQALCEYHMTDDEWDQIVLLSGGTDGEDGPTDAAGAIVDSSVHKVAVDKRLDVSSFLKRNDAYSFFEQTGGLFITGPTGTNVCDLRVGIAGGGRLDPDSSSSS